MENILHETRQVADNVGDYILPLSIRANAAELQTGGKLRRCRLTRKQRLLRAAKSLGIAWGLILPALIIPLLHFALVPVLLVAGPILAYLRYQVSDISISANVKCPLCADDTVLQMDANTVYPTWETCASCDASIQLRIAQ